MAEIRISEIPYLIKDVDFGEDVNAVRFVGTCIMHQGLTKSQCFQDIFAVFGTNKPGFFVEFGATNGVDGSNTWLLEKYYNWTGILAEPNPDVWSDLNKNRQCKTDNRCVFDTTNTSIQFDVTDEPDLSTISGFGNSDEHASKRVNKKSYTVKTVTLHDLLQEHNAPAFVDYVSIDTEGSEYTILKAFFDNPKNTDYTINKFTVEHNYDDNKRNIIYELMIANGYKRVYPEISRWDDFYIKDNK